MFLPLRRNFVFRLLLASAVCFLVIVTFQAYLLVLLERVCFSITDDIEENVIVWWTPFTIDIGRAKQCGKVSCFFTNNRKYRNHPNYRGLLFYGSRFNVTDLPLDRGWDEEWGLLHEESPRNTPILAHDPLLNLFNYSSTFSRHSDLPLTLQYLTSIDDLTSTKYYKTFEEKEILQKRESLAPVVYIQSDCITPTNRDSYVAELMNYIQVDSYGECLKNKQLPQSLSDSLKTMLTAEMFEFVSKYKFAIAFENGICDDYITEKLWRPLIAGVVPVYFGSPSAQDWTPNNRSAIFANDFASPQELAKYLNRVATSKREYESHLGHKLGAGIENKRLVAEMDRRHWDVEGESSFVDAFECLMCSGISASSGRRIVTRQHYSCPDPVSIVDLKYNSSNWWHRDWEVNRCAASHLRRVLDNGGPLPSEAQLFEAAVSALQNDRTKC